MKITIFTLVMSQSCNTHGSGCYENKRVEIPEQYSNISSITCLSHDKMAMVEWISNISNTAFNAVKIYTHVV